MKTWLEARLVDDMLDAYVDWREACRLADDAYRSWGSATGPGAGVAFRRYGAALDAEEALADVYARFVRRIGEHVESDQPRSKPLRAAVRRALR
jgi:hypothetical protein